MIRLARTALVALVTSAAMVDANAAEIKVFSSRAVATVFGEIGPEFERATGHKLNVIIGFSPVFVKQINDGEPFDIIASPPGAINGLVRDGKVIAETRTTLARAGYGVTVRAGAPKPDVSTTEAFKRALLNAKSVGYLPTPGVPELLERLEDCRRHQVESHNTKDRYRERVGRQRRARNWSHRDHPGPHDPRSRSRGSASPEIQVYTVFEAAVSANSKAPEAARALINFLIGPAAIRAIKAQGMEPGQ